MKMHSIRNLVKPAVCAGIAMMLAVSIFGQVEAQAAEEPAETVADFIGRVESGDIEGALQLLTDDVVFVFPPCIQAFGPQGCIGKEQAAVGLQKAFDAQGHITVLDESVSGSTVVQRQEVTSQAILAAGVDRIIIKEATWELRDGLIARQIDVPDASDPQTAQFLAAMVRMQPPSTGDGGLVNSESSSFVGPRAGTALVVAIAVTVAILTQRQRVSRLWRSP